MILNLGNIPYISQNGIDYKPTSYMVSRIIPPNIFNYYYNAIVVYPGENISLLSALSSNIIDEVNNKDVYLIYCAEKEPSTLVANLIYLQLVNTNIIPAEKIIIVSDNYHIKNYIELLSVQYNRTRIKSYWTMTGEWAMSTALKKSTVYSNNKYEKPNSNTKKFISLNRRWRIHRPALVSLLYTKDLLRFGHISMALSDDNVTWDTVTHDILETVKPNYHLYSLIKNNQYNISKLPPMTIDTENLTEIGLESLSGPNSDMFKYYKETFFSLVTETLYFEKDIFISEKTFKPIAFKHPFVMVGSHQHLAKLRSLGYKTFHPFINESYDDIADPLQRLGAIVDEVERLCKLDDVELDNFISNVYPIIEHNFKTLMLKGGNYYFHDLTLG